MICPRTSRFIIHVMGMVYPAYGSYRALRTRNADENLRWTMYWIVFAMFTALEIFTDIFLSWVPLYHEVKTCVVIWLVLSQASSILYKNLVHPLLLRKEEEIEEAIREVKCHGSAMVWHLGTRSVTYLTTRVKQRFLESHEVCEAPSSATCCSTQPTHSQSCSAITDVGRRQSVSFKL